MVRFVWNCMGSSNRTPLPACVYNTIRKEFPSDNGTYKGFEEEGEDEDDEEGEDDDEAEGDEEEEGNEVGEVSEGEE